MCRAWLPFTHDLDPNSHGISSVTYWPSYTKDHPTNMVFRVDNNQNGTYVELTTIVFLSWHGGISIGHS
jgi:hypothetical protein